MCYNEPANHENIRAHGNATRANHRESGFENCRPSLRKLSAESLRWRCRRISISRALSSCATFFFQCERYQICQTGLIIISSAFPFQPSVFSHLAISKTGIISTGIHTKPSTSYKPHALFCNRHQSVARSNAPQASLDSVSLVLQARCLYNKNQSMGPSRSSLLLILTPFMHAPMISERRCTPRTRIQRRRRNTLLNGEIL